MNILFVCSRNQWRSPTAERIFRKRPGLKVRSAGTSPRARRTLSIADVHWADVVFVMETKHKNRILASFPRAVSASGIVVLDIPDVYRFMDPELVEMLDDAVTPMLAKREGED